MNINKIRNELAVQEADVKAHQAIKKQEDKISELKCHNCERWLDQDDHWYYFCQNHKNVFCDRCAKNNYKNEISNKDAPRCKNKFLNTIPNGYVGESVHPDCIYLKRFLRDVE